MSNTLECPELKQELELPFQTFGVATYDSLFKHVLDAAEVRPSFFFCLHPSFKYPLFYEGRCTYESIQRTRKPSTLHRW